MLKVNRLKYFPVIFENLPNGAVHFALHGLLNSDGTSFANYVPAGWVITVDFEVNFEASSQQLFLFKRTSCLDIQSKNGWIRLLCLNSTSKMAYLRVNSAINRLTLIFRLYHYPDIETEPVLKEVYQGEVEVVSKINKEIKPKININFSPESFWLTPLMLILPERNEEDQLQLLPGFEDYFEPVYQLSQILITPELFHNISPHSTN